QMALLDGLADGTIDMIATDHAPHAKEEKNQGFQKSAFGITGIETSFPLMYTRLVRTGLISLEKLVELMAVKPAQLFGLKGVGTIGLNQKADFTIIDLNQDYTINETNFLSKGTNSPFIGQSVFGQIQATYVNGKAVYTNNH